MSFGALARHLRFVHRGQTQRLAGVHQVTGDFGLAVHHHVLAAGQLVHVDAVALALEQQVKAAVHQAFGMHALADAGLVEQVDADLFEHAGADAGEHVVAGLAFEDDGVDAGLVEQLAEQQAGRASANDGNLGAGGFGHGERFPGWLKNQ